MTAVTSNPDRRNAISGVLISKVDRKHLLGFLKETSIEHDKDDSNDTLTICASSYFQSNTPADDQCQCDDCYGISSSKLSACPYCGVVGEAAEAKPAAPPPPATMVMTTPRAVAPTVETPKKGRKPAAAATAAATPDAGPLNEAVQDIRKHISAGAQAMWEAGKAVLAVFAPQLWKLRTHVDEDGKAKQSYRSFEKFCVDEIGVVPNYAYSLMDVAEHFTKEQVATFGHTKLTLVLQAPEKDQPKLLEQVEKGASWRDIKKEVSDLKKKTGHRRQTRKGASKGNRDTTAATKAREEKRAKAAKTDKQVTVAKLLGRETVKLYCKPSGSNVDPKDLKPAKKMTDLPWGKLEMANGIEEEFFLQTAPDGSLRLVVQRKRIKE